MSRILSHPEGFFWNAMANDYSSHSVFQIKSLDKQVQEHQAHKLRGNMASCRYVQALMVTYSVFVTNPLPKQLASQLQLPSPSL